MDFGLYKTWNYMLCVCCPLVMTRLILTTSADVKLVKYSRTLLNLGKTAHCSWCHNGEIKQKCDIKLGLRRVWHASRTDDGKQPVEWILECGCCKYQESTGYRIPHVKTWMKSVWRVRKRNGFLSTEIIGVDMWPNVSSVRLSSRLSQAWSTNV